VSVEVWNGCTDLWKVGIFLGFVCLRSFMRISDMLITFVLSIFISTKQVIWRFIDW